MRTSYARRRALAVPLAVATMAAGLLASSAPTQAATTQDAVDSHWLGLGYNQDPLYRVGQTGDGNDKTTGDQVWTNEAFDQMADRADFIRPGLVRIMINRGWFDAGAGKPYKWTSPQMQNVFRVLDHYKQQHVSVVTGMWGMADAFPTDEGAKLQADLMHKFVVDQGYGNIVRYIGINEPNSGAGLKYADWAAGNAKLHAAFDAAHLDKDLIGGPDTAEAGISAQDGDLGLMSVPVANATAKQTLVWHKPGLTSFTARLYRTPDEVGYTWTFQASKDGSSWKDVDIQQTAPVETSATTAWWGVDVSARDVPAGTNFLQLTMKKYQQGEHPVERAVSSVTINTPTGTFTDPMNDLSLTSDHSTGWTYPGGSQQNDWWLQSALDHAVAQEEAHFYDHEVDLGTPAEYPEGVLKEAVRQLKAASGGRSVILGETGMKAPGDDSDPGGKTYDFTSEYEHGVRMADLAVQEARAGLDGAMSWCLDGYAPDTQCGMWDHTQTVEKQALRHWFYTWSLLCRYLPADSQIYAPQQPAGVRVLKAKLPASAGGGWTFVLVNRTATTAKVTMTAQTGGNITLNKYVYSDGNEKVDAKGFPVPSDRLTASFDNGHDLTVGPDSVVVFTTAS
ncbi:hypothetical protein [Krasilnikovia sp. MM14-A1259]|uniref:hypothetical protein n=1 Tax=Krasilnikovia sp. MM14-A1259 TaxID=3373539 RepID=UPI00380F741B